MLRLPSGCFSSIPAMLSLPISNSAVSLTGCRKAKPYYQQEIDKTRRELDQLKSDPRILEKYAREKYRMKKDNEDLYVISANPVQ